MKYLTSTTLVETVKRKAAIPENNATFAIDDFLAFANEELSSSLLPLILSMQEEYYVYPEEITFETNVSNYPIPYRAVGGKLRDLFYKDTTGQLTEMTRISPENKVLFQYNPDSNAYFKYFYIEGNNIVIIPKVGNSPIGAMVATYYLRPNELVDSSRIATITDIEEIGSDTVYTLDQVPSVFSVVPMDINQTKSGHKIRAFDIIPTALSTGSKTITFTTADLTTDIEIGDHIALAGECFVPQIPTDLHPILAQRVTQRCLESLGDAAGLQAATAKLQEMETRSTALIDNRVEGAALKVVNRKGLLRNSRLRKW